MNKKIWMWMALVISLLMSGCAGADTKEAAVVEELPIEQEGNTGNNEGTGDFAQNPEGTPAEEKEPYEELEIEVNGNKGTIVVGTTGAPFTEILTQAKIQLASDGWDLQIIKYEDHLKLNEDVLNGTLDAHLFAHQAYLDSYNGVNSATLVPVDAICYEVFGIFSKINQDLTKISSGALIGIPADDTLKAHALLYMQDLKWIVLKEDVGMTAVLDDITENTKKFEFVEYTQDNLEQILEEADYCVLGANQAVVAGFLLEEDRLLHETNMSESSRVFSTQLVAKEENVTNEKMKVLVNVLKSKDMKIYMEEAYKGAYSLMR